VPIAHSWYWKIDPEAKGRGDNGGGLWVVVSLSNSLFTKKDGFWVKPRMTVGGFLPSTMNLQP
jgi:hypothetical protein